MIRNTTITNPWHREEEPHKNHETPGRQTKQRNQQTTWRPFCVTKANSADPIRHHRTRRQIRVSTVGLHNVLSKFEEKWKKNTHNNPLKDGN